MCKFMSGPEDTFINFPQFYCNLWTAFFVIVGVIEAGGVSLGSTHRLLGTWSWRHNTFSDVSAALWRHMLHCEIDFERENFLMLKWFQKSKLRPTRQRIILFVIENTRWVKTAKFKPLQIVVMTNWHLTAHYQGSRDALMSRTDTDWLIIRLTQENQVIIPTWSEINIFTWNPTQ